jgi:hypothetical protein
VLSRLRRSHAPRTKALAGLVLAAVLSCPIVGCGAANERVERTVVTVVKTIPAPPHHARKASQRHQATRKLTSAFVACDPNISARRGTTSCPFAENTFYEYWASGEASGISAYSPATQRSYDLNCHGGTMVRCTAGDGAEVRFPATAVAAYTDDEADRYAASADLGPGGGGVDDSDSYDDWSEDPDSGDYGDEIPNYDNGRGYRVQCADGMYSQSGGIQGACSGHGGVG